MVEISLSGSGEGPGREIARGYSTVSRARPMSERRRQIHAEHALSKTRRCELLDVARSSAYYRPEPVSEEDLAEHVNLFWTVIPEIAHIWPGPERLLAT